MAREHTIQTAFHAGEWRGTLAGRVDQERYRASCRRLRNFLPLVEGAAEKRPGFKFAALGADPNVAGKPSRLIRFEFNDTDAYTLEFGDFVMRVFRNHALVESAPGVPYVIGTPYSAEQAHEIKTEQSADVLWLFHRDVQPHRLERTGHAAWSLVPYGQDWTDVLVPSWPPFSSENDDRTLKVYASAATGLAITLTANLPVFEDTDVGAYLQLREIIATEHTKWIQQDDPLQKDGGTHVDLTSEVYYEQNVYLLVASPGTTGTRPPIHGAEDTPDGAGNVDRMDGYGTPNGWTWRYLHSGAGYVRITEFVSATEVRADVIRRLPTSVVGAAGATVRWSFGAWDSRRGYPAFGVLFEDRMYTGGTDTDPDTIWATRPGGEYDSFRPSEDAEGALTFRLNSAQPQVISSAVATNVLYIVTSGGVFPLAALDSTQAISLENLPSLGRQLPMGGEAAVQPIAVDNVALFVQRGGRALREIQFDDSQRAYAATDAAKIASHLTVSGITSLAYQLEPYRIVWAATADGSLLALAYDRPQEVLAWAKMELGGSLPFVESVCVIPHPDGDVDELWISVRRMNGGTTTRTIEYLERSFGDDTALEDGFFVDSGVTYDGAPVLVVSGLSHLEGQSVAILADGARVADQVVAGGSVTLLESASVVHVGLAYRGLTITQRLEAGADSGIAQGRIGRIVRGVLRTYRTGEGLKYGVSESLADLDERLFRDTFDIADAPPPIGDDVDSVSLEWPGGNDQGKFVAIVHDGPTPCTLLALIVTVVTGDR